MEKAINKEPISGKVMDNKCPSCNAKIIFDPELQKWKCDYCRKTFTVEEFNSLTEVEDSKVDTDARYVNYTCNNCGAEIIADEQTSATFCLYCGNTAILKNKLSGEFAPDGVIPFKVKKEEAITAFKKLLKKKMLYPKTFSNVKNINKITGLYIPFWIYDLEMSGGIVADATKVTTWTIGRTHYTKTDYYHVIRNGNMKFNDIPVDGSTRFENDIMNSIEPFDYKDIVKFNPAYLSGFLAEKYDIDKETDKVDAVDRAKNTSIDVLLNDIHGYSTKRVISNTIENSSLNANYVLLPAYMVNVKYKDKFYLFAMNGQTGKFVGNIPTDKKKAFIFGLILFIVLFAIIILISYISYMGGTR